MDDSSWRDDMVVFNQRGRPTCSGDYNGDGDCDGFEMMIGLVVNDFEVGVLVCGLLEA